MHIVLIILAVRAWYASTENYYTLLKHRMKGNYLALRTKYIFNKKKGL